MLVDTAHPEVWLMSKSLGKAIVMYPPLEVLSIGIDGTKDMLQLLMAPVTWLVGMTVREDCLAAGAATGQVKLPYEMGAPFVVDMVKV